MARVEDKREAGKHPCMYKSEFYLLYTQSHKAYLQSFDHHPLITLESQAKLLLDWSYNKFLKQQNNRKLLKDLKKKHKKQL